MANATMKMRNAAAAFRAQPVAPRSGRVVACNAVKREHGVSAAMAAATLLLVSGQPAHALTFNEIQALTYKEVKGSGIANTCPEIVEGSSNPKDLAPGKYRMQRFCMEPTSFQVKEVSGLKGVEDDFLPTKLLTRNTYSLDQMEGTFVVNKDGSVQFKEQDGIDYAPVTVSMPGGEYVPLMFTIKQFDAQGDLEKGFSGPFVVPSYRGASFMDPKGRGAASGYESTVGLYAAQDDEKLAKENKKSAAAREGRATFTIASVDPSTGEVAGVFESYQPSDNDLGAKVSKDVRIRGLWYSQLEPIA